jgi:ABC-type uncharacterized transport system substrate-binding protein
MSDEDNKKDTQKELKETQQEVMIDLKIKTNRFLTKLKEQSNKNRLKTDGI